MSNGNGWPAALMSDSVMSLSKHLVKKTNGIVSNVSFTWREAYRRP